MKNIKKIFAVIFAVTTIILMNVTVFALQFTVQPNDGEAYPYDTAKITWTMDRQPVWMEISNNAETIKHWSNPIGTTFSYDLPPAKYPYKIYAYYSGLYTSDEFYVREKSAIFNLQPKSKYTLDNEAEITWELNFTPVKQYLLVGDEQDRNLGSANSAFVEKSGSTYRIRAYYNDLGYVDSNDFYVTDEPVFLIQPDKKQYGITSAEVKWKINFTPKKLQAIYDDESPINISTTASSFELPPRDKSDGEPKYKIRAYYDSQNYIESEPFLVCFKYLITLDCNGVTPSSTMKTQFEVNDGEEFKIPYFVGTVPEHMQLSGWKYKDTLYKQGYYTTVTESGTWVAQWTPQKFMVEFSLGECPLYEPDVQFVEYNKTAVEPTLPNNWGEYFFGGWYSDKSLTTKFNFDTPITSRTVIYAKWEKINNSITVSTNGGNKISKTVFYGNEVSVTFDFLDPKKEINCTIEYPLDGQQKFATQNLDQYTNSLTLNPYKEPYNDILKPNKLIKIYAVGTDLNGEPASSDILLLTVVYKQGDLDFNGIVEKADAKIYLDYLNGIHDFNEEQIKIADMNYDDILNLDDAELIYPIYECWYLRSKNAGILEYVLKGDKLPKYDVIEEKGHIFGGWFTDWSFSEEFDFEQPIMADTSVYEKWTLETYTVSFNMNGHGENPAPQSVSYGNKVTEPAIPNIDGYVFYGWFTDSNCTQEFDLDAPITDNTELFAKWVSSSENTYPLGDANCNGVVTENDALLVYRSVITNDHSILPVKNKVNDYTQIVDIDNDKMLTANDSALILKMINK